MIEFLTEYKKALGLRILVFSFIGMGWDVLMTTLQMILGNHLEKKRGDDGQHVDVSGLWLHSSGGPAFRKSAAEV